MREDKAVFGGGCFWGVEELFERLEGVKSAVSGYMGGHVKNPSYEQVCSGRTGHAEVVQVTYDPEQVSYKELLDYFFRMHDPTTPNQQDVNIGTQYRSVIFTLNDKQQKEAKDFILMLEDKNVFPSPIITEVSPATTFWEAEYYHQDYYKKKYMGGVGPICHALRPESFI